MTARKRSTVRDSTASAPARKTQKLPPRIDEPEQAKATWEGEGGAIADPTTSALSPSAPAEDVDEDTAAVDVIDTIASIEMHRQWRDKEVGRDVARTEALRKLHDALAAEKASAAGAVNRSTNVAAVERAIDKLQVAPQGRRDSARDRNATTLRVPEARENPTRSPARSRGRRTMGRYGKR